MYYCTSTVVSNAKVQRLAINIRTFRVAFRFSNTPFSAFAPYIKEYNDGRSYRCAILLLRVRTCFVNKRLWPVPIYNTVARLYLDVVALNIFLTASRLVICMEHFALSASYTFDSPF